MAKYLLTIVFLWLLVLLFNAPIPGEILENEWEFLREVPTTQPQQELETDHIHALKLNVSPSDKTASSQDLRTRRLPCRFLPKP